jgi:hypothetical protein
MAKYYIEKDIEGRVVTKGITTDTAVFTDWQIEVTEEEFGLIEQYVLPYEETPTEPTLEERLAALEMAMSFVLGM